MEMDASDEVRYEFCGAFGGTFSSLEPWADLEWSLISCTEFCVDWDCIEPCFSAETGTVCVYGLGFANCNIQRERDGESVYALFAATEWYCFSKCTFSCSKLNIPSAELVEIGDLDADEAMDRDRYVSRSGFCGAGSESIETEWETAGLI